jgi:hypothetical protein
MRILFREQPYLFKELIESVDWIKAKNKIVILKTIEGELNLLYLNPRYFIKTYLDASEDSPEFKSDYMIVALPGEDATTAWESYKDINSTLFK